MTTVYLRLGEMRCCRAADTAAIWRTILLWGSNVWLLRTSGPTPA